MLENSVKTRLRKKDKAEKGKNLQILVVKSCTIQVVRTSCKKLAQIRNELYS